MSGFGGLLFYKKSVSASSARMAFEFGAACAFGGRLKPSSLQRVFILPFVFLLCCLIATIAWLLYRAGEEATAMLSQNALIDVMNRVNQNTERQLFSAHATLDVIAPKKVLTQEGEQRPNVPFPSTMEGREERLWIATSLFPNDNSFVYFGGADGSYLGIQQLGGGRFQLWVRDSLQSMNHIYDLGGPDEKPLLHSAVAYEPRSRAWYVSAVSQKHETWSPVFSDFRTKTLAIALSKPVYGRNGELLGVATSSIFLSKLSGFLQALTIGESGVAFIMEPDGALIASSTKESLFSYRGQQLVRLKVTEGASPLMREVSADILAFFRTHDVADRYTKTTTIDGTQGKIVVSANMQSDQAGLKWIVASAVPSDDYYGSFTGSVYRTLLLGLVAVGITFLLGFVILRRVLRDLRTLTLAATRIGNGEPFMPLDIKRNDEIGQLANSFQEMERNLHMDRLTGVLNRESLIAQIEFRLRSASQTNTPLYFALMFIDLDKFKTINDQYGHDEGDKVLIEAAAQLRDAMRKDDAVSRFGGDEFMIYLHGVESAATAASIAEKIRLCLCQPIAGRDGAMYYIDASIGFAIYPEDGLDVETLLRVSDHRMFDKKRSNR
jgi:diguanylate cyclase (GGDEF)-like protein